MSPQHLSRPPSIGPIISVDRAAELLGTELLGVEARQSGEADVVLADVRWYLDGRSGRAAFEAGHIPGAIFVDLDTDLSDQNQSPTSGRHPFPPAGDFAASMSALGIGDDTIVIAYDDSGGGTAGRLVFMLRIIGRAATLLDGGLRAWPQQAQLGPSAPRRRQSFTAAPWPADRFADAGELGRPSARCVVLDARAADRYQGLNNAVDARPGHIPHALNAPWAANLSPDGTFKTTDELTRHYASLGVQTASSVVCYCGSGVSACNDLLALEHLGVSDTRLFVPSWSGWSADPSRPAALGTGPA
jgi:thiosulfate/3-mercaptopyruvate sulfurtransferase